MNDKELIDEIEELRHQLNKLINENLRRHTNDVIKLSERLDNLINRYLKQD